MATLDALPDDLRDLLVALADAEVEFVISGVDFETARTGASVLDLDGRSISVIGRSALLANKRAAGRHKDLDDVEWLEAHPPRRS